MCSNSPPFRRPGILPPAIPHCGPRSPRIRDPDRAVRTRAALRRQNPRRRNIRRPRERLPPCPLPPALPLPLLRPLPNQSRRCPPSIPNLCSAQSPAALAQPAVFARQAARENSFSSKQDSPLLLLPAASRTNLQSLFATPETPPAAALNRCPPNRAACVFVRPSRAPKTALLAPR